MNLAREGREQSKLEKERVEANSLAKPGDPVVSAPSHGSAYRQTGSTATPQSQPGETAAQRTARKGKEAADKAAADKAASQPPKTQQDYTDIPDDQAAAGRIFTPKREP